MEGYATVELSFSLFPHQGAIQTRSQQRLVGKSLPFEWKYFIDIYKCIASVWSTDKHKQLLQDTWVSISNVLHLLFSLSIFVF